MFAMVIVLVVASDAQQPPTKNVTDAISEALGADAVILEQQTPRPDAADLEPLASSISADAAASIVWTSQNGGRAHVRLLVRRTGATSERDIDFRAADASGDRARAVGFAIASMLPASMPADLPAPPPATPPAAPTREIERPPPPPPPPAPSDDRSARRWGIEALAMGTMGVGGEADGFGAELGATIAITRSFDVRASMGATRGALTSSNARLTVMRPRVGAGWTVAVLGPVSMALRLDVGPCFHLVESHANASPSTGSRWVPAATPAGEIQWRLAPAFEILAKVGAEVAFGTTRVLVADEERGTIPAVRLVGQTGVRLLF